MLSSFMRFKSKRSSLNIQLPGHEHIRKKAPEACQTITIEISRVITTAIENYVSFFKQTLFPNTLISFLRVYVVPLAEAIK